MKNYIQFIKENINLEIDPYGEEDWGEDFFEYWIGRIMQDDINDEGFPYVHPIYVICGKTKLGFHALMINIITNELEVDLYRDTMDEDEFEPFPTHQIENIKSGKIRLFYNDGDLLTLQEFENKHDVKIKGFIREV